MRRLLAALVLFGAPLLYLVRRRASRRERVHLYFDDGSMVTVERSRPEAERLLTLAHAAL
jgi:hypothetical protein